MWQINGSRARWESARFEANVELAQPDCGLTGIRLGGAVVHDGNLLQILVPNRPPDGPQQIDDCYVRGTDLIVHYAETSRSPVRPQVYWRVIDHPALSEAVSIDAILSNQTLRLDSDPRMRIACTLPGDAWFSTPGGPLAADFQRVVIPDQVPVPVTPAPPGCMLLMRPADAAWSYGQIVQTTDLVNAELTWDATHRRSTFTAEFFADRLEKGVIRRVCARGILVPRGQDEQLVATQFERSVRSAPPLET